MRVLVVGFALLCASAPGWAQEWSPLDARTRALGGAGVAFADGRGESGYWNPASLAVGSEKVLDFSTGFSFSLSFFTDAHVTGKIVSDVNRVLDQYDAFNFRAVQDEFNSATPTFTESDVQNALRVVDSLSRLNQPGKGVLLDAGAGFDLRVGPFGLFVHALANVGANPVVDFLGVSFTTNTGAFFANLPPAGALSPAGTNLSNQLAASGLSPAEADALAFQAQQGLGDAAISDPAFIAAMSALAQGTSSGSTTSLYDSPSGVFIRGLAQAEAGISFALPVLPTLLDVGISLKHVISETSFKFLTFAEQDSGEDVGDVIRDDLTKNNRRRSSHFNIDLGARVAPLEWLTLALSARNVIPMDVEYAGPGGDLHLDPQVRFGAVACALGFLRVGFDVDLMENDSPVLPGYSTRHVGVGIEFDLSVLKLRFGYADNLAFPQDRGRLTAGIGLDVFGFVLDLGVQGSLVETQYQPDAADGSESSKTIPTDRVSVGLTIGVNLPF